jgi:uncharacterized protein YeaO (DUF488 family)
VAIRIVRLGTPRARGEGVRLGTVRRPPRGVRKSDYAKRDFYDAWLPELAPSAALMKWIHGGDAITKQKWARFAKAYRGEMREPAPQRLIEALARLSQDADFAVGCYCEGFDRCHRSILRELLLERGARIAAD